MSSASQLVECPSCQRKLPLAQLNPHLDRCLSDEKPRTSTTTNGNEQQPKAEHGMESSRQKQAKATMLDHLRCRVVSRDRQTLHLTRRQRVLHWIPNRASESRMKLSAPTEATFFSLNSSNTNSTNRYPRHLAAASTQPSLSPNECDPSH